MIMGRWEVVKRYVNVVHRDLICCGEEYKRM
jgi:hypothetical protein